MASIENRNRLESILPAGILVTTAYDTMQLAGDMAAPFLQESNFLWLTGVKYAGWKAIIDLEHHRMTLVRPNRSVIEEIFDGTVDEATLARQTGADAVISMADCETYLRKLSQLHSVVYTVRPRHDYGFVVNPAQKKLDTILKRIFPDVIDCSTELGRLRAIKTPDEIAAIRRAVNLTANAFSKVHSGLDSYRYEYQIEADMTAYFRYHDGRHAYEPIVAGGRNATTLHYTANDTKLSRAKMILIDVGARVDGYAADITRTYCLAPTKRQRAVHAAVAEAQGRIIDLLQPGLEVAQYTALVDEIMKDALQELGLLDQRDDEVRYRRYFPHAVSHGLGLDVHDSLGGPRSFKSGMVLTVEPGIYIPEESIGVRLEDDILVTDDGYENLSRKLPVDY